MKYGFLGPSGTYTEEALLSVVKADTEDLVAYSTESEVIHALERGEVDKGIVPIENSIEGSVNATLDVFAFDSKDVTIERELTLPISHHLIAPPGLSIEQVQAVISHPQATAQCRKYLASKLPHAKLETASSTAEAVRMVAERQDSVAAIGPRLAAKLYGLSILDSEIEDFEGNTTRFVIVGKEPPKPSGHDKTSIVCFIYEDRPGMLLQILQEFAFRYINLTKIQSRPTRKALGEYCFFIDLLGHTEDENIASAFNCLRCKIREVKVLGSYPMADTAGNGGSNAGPSLG